MLLFWLLTNVLAEIVWNLPEVAQRETKIATEKLQGSIVVPFSGVVGRGFIPVAIDLQNVTSEPQSIDINIGYSSYESTFRQRFQLQPGERKEQQVLLPNSNIGYVLQGGIQVDDKINASFTANIDQFMLSDFASGFQQVPRLFLSNDTSEDLHPEWFAASMLEKKEATPSSVHISDSRWLPLDSAGYTSQFNVIWFVEDVALDSRVEKAIASWVLGGGHIILVTRGASLLQLASFSEWLEPRFEIPLASVSPDVHSRYLLLSAALSARKKSLYRKHMSLDESVTGNTTRHRMGMGAITVVRGNISMKQAFDLQMDTKTNTMLLYNNKSNSAGDDVGVFNEYTLRRLSGDWQELELTPDFVIWWLTVMFAIIVGPVNLVWSMERKRIFLLYSTPAVALLCVGFVMIVSLFLRTNSVRGLTTEIVVLDQRNQRLVSSEHRLFFLVKGLSEPLRPRFGYHILPISHYSSGDHYIEEVDGERVYRRYAKSRKIQAQWGWHDTSSRLQLQFSGGEVTNALETDIDELYYSDEQGQLWSAFDIDSGEKASLKKTDSLPTSKKHWTNPIMERPFVHISELPARTYLVRTEKRTFDHQDEIAQKMSKQDQLIFGVLP